MRFSPANLLVAAILSLSTPTAQAATEIPFETSSGMIWVKVACAGHEPLSFLLDSGAGVSVFDLGTARRLALPLGSRETVRGTGGDAAAFRLRGVHTHLSGVPLAANALAVDLGGISRCCGRHVDGLIGLDFFRQRAVQIDYAAHKLRLLDHGEASRVTGVTVPIAFRGDSACIRVAVGTQPAGWMRLDTGCDSALEWVRSGSQHVATPRASIAAAHGSGHTMTADVTLGTERLLNVPVGVRDSPLFPGESGLVGNGLLSRYHVTVDVGQKRLVLGRP